MTCKSTVIPPAALAALLLLLFATYHGAYYWGVQPGQINRGARLVPTYFRFTSDPIANLRIKAFFAPAHWLDRRIRPRVWEANISVID